MSWQEGDLIEVEVGDGNGHVVLPNTWFVWCRPVATGTATVMQWRTDEPVPPEGTLVGAEYRYGILYYPRSPLKEDESLAIEDLPPMWRRAEADERPRD